MTSIATFSGVGSGIDFDSIREAIIADRSQPVTQMQTQVSTYSSRVDALTQLNASLAALTTASDALNDRTLGAGRSTVPGDSTVLTASATSTATLGAHDISVTRLASSFAQASRTFDSTTGTVLADGATSATFELRTGGAASGTPITIDSTNNTLEGLRDAINAGNAGVTASIVDINGDGTGNKLVLRSTATGSTGAVQLVETTSTGTLDGLGLSSLNPPDGDTSKLNAQFSLDGLTLTRPTNSVSDALSGVTLNFKKTGTSSLGITQSTDIENKLRAFVSAYNAVQQFIGTQYQTDSNGKPTGVLAGESTLRNVQQQLRDATNTIASANGGVYTSLSDIGITKNDDGTLAFDSTAFNAALTANPNDVQALLYGKTDAQNGVFESIDTVFKGLSDNITGSVQTSIVGYQSTMKNLNDQIDAQTLQINALNTSLTSQFSIADAAISQLNGQSTALTNIIKSLQATKD